MGVFWRVLVLSSPKARLAAAAGSLRPIRALARVGLDPVGLGVLAARPRSSRIVIDRIPAWWHDDRRVAGSQRE